MRVFTPRLLVLLLVSALLGPATAVAAVPAPQDDTLPAVTLSMVGTYDSGQFDAEAAEIVTYDPDAMRAYVVNGGDKTIDILDLSDPAAPALVSQVDITAYGAGANSVDFHDGVVAIAVEAEDKQANGSVVFIDGDGAFINSIEVGALPDMVTFTPDGMTVLTANEGEPSGDYTVDPEGSISIIDVSGGVADVTAENVTTADFIAFNDAALDPAIRIFGPGATVAQDLEPEYIAVTPDSSTAYVTLQENNAVAVVDIVAGEVIAVVPLGFKNYNAPVAGITMAEFTDLPVLGTTAAGEEILLGGFSGLYFEGVDEETGNLKFITHPDRGPNGDPADVDGDGINERPFPLPEFQSEWVRFEFNPESGEVSITERVGLTRDDGTPITGLPNLTGDQGMAFADEEPIDLMGHELELDPYGADMEGIVRAEDGTYWMVDEYRPAIYHFDAEGVLIDRFVPAFPESDDEEEGEEMVDVGTPTLPEVFAQRRANRGFEAVALKDGLLYAFIQSPIDNPDTSDDASSKASTMARIVEFDTATGETVGQYLYMLDGGAIDKIGDAVALPDGDFLVIERDSAVGAGAQKLIYKMSLENATNIHESEALPVGPNGGLERQRELGLARAGIVPASKSLYVDLGALGYTMGDKPEGLAFVDENTLAVLNDNDFGLLGSFDIETGMLDENPNATPVVLGIIHLRENGFDASDRDDAINIRNWPVFGMYQPDSIAAFETADGVFLATANEGDARDYDGYSEEIRGEDWLLDLAVFPNAAELQQSENLGRMKSTTANGDTDGDGLIDTLYGFGARSLSIWDANGTLVWDSGNEIARVLEAELPDNFNSNGENDTFDNRSDDKGAEPEALTVGTIGDHTYVFLGLERVGGIMVYDVTDVRNPQFVSYFNPRDFSAADEEAGDLAPEGLEFVPAEQSPTGGPILIVANEFSGTTSVYAIETNLE